MQVTYVRVAAQEPQQFIYDRAQMQFFCGQQRKTLRQVEPHLVPERTDRSGPGPVAFDGSVVLYVS